ncbi:hypothetical protein HNR44_001514 [Geomicrobium halophilum]|uniref:Uncharacterized protein n=1 Tax=Geomicrobium halophilum TaxID=549000 RepID=A0A841PZ17_9BACL|nr:hypothetical protein [Geomicrobium halophilum]
MRKERYKQLTKEFQRKLQRPLTKKEKELIHWMAESERK